MKTLISTTAFAVAIVGASGAAFGETELDPVALTCSDFAAMELADQEIAVAAIEATKMEMAEEGLVDDSGDAMAEENVVDEDTIDGGATDDVDVAEPVETDAEADATDEFAEASPVVEGLLIACDGNDEMFAIDAFGSYRP